MRIRPLPCLLLALAATGSAQRVVRTNGARGDAWSFDGKRILGFLKNDVCLWDATTGRLLHRMKGHGNYLYSVAMSPDGRLAASSSWARSEVRLLDQKDTNTRVWDLDTGQQVALLDGQVAPQFSPDGRRIVTFSVTKSDEGHSAAEVWETATGRHVASLQLDPFTPIDFSTLVFSPDGTRILFQRADSLTVYDAADGRRLGRNSQVTPGVVHNWIGARFADAHERVAAVAEDRFSVEALERYATPWRREFPAAMGWDWVAWSADASRAIAVSDNGLWLWDVSHNTTRWTPMPFGSTHRVFAAPSGDRCLVIDFPHRNEGSFHFALIDPQHGKLIADYAPGNTAEFLGFSPDGATFLILSGTVYQYRSRDGAPLREFVIEDVPTTRPGEERGR